MNAKTSLLFILTLLFFFTTKSYAVTITPASITVICEPGQKVQTLIKIYGSPVTKYLISIEPLRKTGGVVLNYADSIILDENGIGEVNVTITCVSPGVYLFRYSVTEKRLTNISGTGVGAREASAGLLRVVVKGVAVYAKAWLQKDTWVIRVSAYSFAVHVVNGTIQMLLPNGSLLSSKIATKTPFITYFEVPIKVVEDLENPYIKVVFNATTFEGVNLIATTTVRLEHIVFNVDVDVDLKGHTLLLALPWQQLVTLTALITVVGNATSCNLFESYSIDGNTFPLGSSDVKMNSTFTRKLSIAVDPWRLAPYSLEVNYYVKLLCEANAGDESSNSIRIIVVPMAFILLLFVLVFISLLIVRAVAARRAM